MRSERLLVIVAVMCMMALAVPLMADDSDASQNIETSNGVVITVIDDSLKLNRARFKERRREKRRCCFYELFWLFPKELIVKEQMNGCDTDVGGDRRRNWPCAD